MRRTEDRPRTTTPPSNLRLPESCGNYQPAFMAWSNDPTTGLRSLPPLEISPAYLKIACHPRTRSRSTDRDRSPKFDLRSTARHLAIDHLGRDHDQQVRRVGTTRREATEQI